MNINLSQPLKSLIGEPLKDADGTTATLGKMLATVLLSAETGGKMKLYILAQKCYQETSISVDEADLAFIKSSVAGSKVFGALVLGQIELILENLKTEDK